VVSIFITFITKYLLLFLLQGHMPLKGIFDSCISVSSTLAHVTHW
jgi:hypothetical protein